MAKVTSSKDLIMLLLYARGREGRKYEPIQGRTRLMKMLFLFNKEVRRRFNLEKSIPDHIFPEFTPYRFGPFSEQVYNDIEFLVDMGLVEAKQITDAESADEEEMEFDYWQAGASAGEDEDHDAGLVEFGLTKLGRDFVEEGRAGKLTEQQWAVMDEFKSRCTAADLKALLAYVYKKYPDMVSESKIKEEILGPEA